MSLRADQVRDMVSLYITPSYRRLCAGSQEPLPASPLNPNIFLIANTAAVQLQLHAKDYIIS
eukprot:SAG31_NODE_2281_length_6022_cov_3.327706_2_plen_62_part_00